MLLVNKTSILPETWSVEAAAQILGVALIHLQWRSLLRATSLLCVRIEGTILTLSHREDP